jgi:DNA-binding response OmpR family regulator
MERSKVKILVVDDEEDIAHYTTKILQYDGFQAFETRDGTKAWEVFEKEHPHICLIDVHLGYSKIDGMELLEKIKAADKKVECIMITRITDQETIDKAKKLGVQHYLLKPLANEVWVEKVHAIADALQEGGRNG